MLILSLAIVFLGTLCSAFPVEKREDTFSLFAYGENISGLPIYYANGLAQIGDPSTAAGQIPIYFTPSTESSKIWIAHANSNTLSKNILYLPDPSSPSSTVGFTESTSSSSKLTKVWTLYGNYVLVNVADAQFYAIPTGTKGWYSLGWSNSDNLPADGSIPVTLRTIQPSTASVL